jgi:uncharacterized protein
VSLALRLETAATAGALVGGVAAGLMPQRALALLFAVVVFASAGYTYFKTRDKARPASEPQIEDLFRQNYKPKNWRTGLSAMSLAGLLSGLSGLGGGFIKVPVMYSMMEVPLGIATATSNFMVGITAAQARCCITAAGISTRSSRCRPRSASFSARWAARDWRRGCGQRPCESC